jgi:hypothetical protein
MTACPVGALLFIARRIPLGRASQPTANDEVLAWRWKGKSFTCPFKKRRLKTSSKLN